MGSSPRRAEILHLHDVSFAGPQIDVQWGVDRYQFATSLWYTTVDFDDLAQRFGGDVVRRLAFHVAMFEINKGASFHPSRLEIAQHLAVDFTDALYDLWRVVVRRVWAQWRYEHGHPDYWGPEPTLQPQPAPAAAVASERGLERDLWFCGGGKDSLLASRVLTSIGHRFDALTYAHSIYGQAEPQLDLIDPMVEASGSAATHRIYMFDTSTDLPLGRLGVYEGLNYVLAAETPASVFASLPIALAHGHENLIVAHERSANVGNLIWDVTGEDVNHQWGKSLEAERLLGEYINRHLVSSVDFFSVLQPVHDALIFGSLQEAAELVPMAHSCNLDKPWCMRCPKCAYVWICYKAWLPWDVVDPTFEGTNLLDLPENQVWYRQMLGLEAHTPFECIGQIDEARLAFAMARARGLRGEAMAHFDEIEDFDADAVLDRYLAIDGENHRIPDHLAKEILGYFEGRAVDARAFANSVLRGDVGHRV